MTKSFATQKFKTFLWTSLKSCYLRSRNQTDCLKDKIWSCKLHFSTVLQNLDKMQATFSIHSTALMLKWIWEKNSADATFWLLAHLHDQLVWNVSTSADLNSQKIYTYIYIIRFFRGRIPSRIGRELIVRRSWNHSHVCVNAQNNLITNKIAIQIERDVMN